MSKKKKLANRKCSALLAVGTGVAVCLTGGSVGATNGNVTGSNTGVAAFGTSFTGAGFGYSTMPFRLFGSAANLMFRFDLDTGTASIYFATPSLGNFKVDTFGVMSHLGSSVTVSAGLGFATAFGQVRASQSNNYIPIQFVSGGTKYGWVHVVSTNAIARHITLDTWSFNSSGGAIKTLSDSVTTSRLALTDGKEKLHWANQNEDGVARYEVQSQDASGAWQAADSDVPGSGSYSAKVDSGKTCRLVVEMTDGSTKEIDF